MASSEYDNEAAIIKDAFPAAVDSFRALLPDKETDPGYTADCCRPLPEGAKLRTNAKISEEDRERGVRERVDYIWLLNSGARDLEHSLETTCTTIEVQECRDPEPAIGDYLSDHSGLFAEFKLRRRNTGKTKKPTTGRSSAIELAHVPRESIEYQSMV